MKTAGITGKGEVYNSPVKKAPRPLKKKKGGELNCKGVLNG